MPRRAPSRSSAPPPDPGSVWEADLSPVSLAFDDDLAARPALLLIVADGFILAGDLVSQPSAVPAEVAQALVEGLRVAAASAGVSPRVVHVRHSAVAENLRALLAASGTTVRYVSELPEVDAALAGFNEMVLGHESVAGPQPRVASPVTWAGWGLPAEQIGRLFSSAARYFRASPWSNVTNEDILRTEVRGGGTWSGSVMGMAGEEFGLALYARHEDLVALLSSDPEHPELAMAAIRGSVISLSYQPRNELPAPMRKEVRNAKWEIAGPDAYPAIMAINTPGGGVTARELEDVIAVLDAIGSFTKEHEMMLSGRIAPAYPIRWRTRDGGVTIAFHGAPDRLV